MQASLYPIFRNSDLSPLFTDQFAFRPTGSTDSAIIAIMHHITNLLSTSLYVRLIALDFSKAFDTVRHSTILAKLTQLQVSDEYYNWFVNYFLGHSHVTKYNNHVSSSASINCSVFQGSVVGTPLFVVNGVDLKPVNRENFIDKYADDTYLIVSFDHESSVGEEITAIEEWASRNNLVLNKGKSAELIIYSSERIRASSPPIPPLPLIRREQSLKILGVTFNENLSIKPHVSNVTQSAAQALYALKTLKSHGLDSHTTREVCHATVISRLTYAAPAWWGFAAADDKQKLQAVVNRAIRWGNCDPSGPNLEQICSRREADLFAKVLSNPNHVLHALLPPLKSNPHNLRRRTHNRQLPEKGGALHSKTFMQRMIYQNVY